MPTHTQVREYLRHLEEDRGLSPSTIRGYRQELRLLVRSKVPMEAEAVSKYVSAKQDGTPLAPSTRNRRLIILRTFFDYLKEQGVIESNPTEDIRRARVPKRKRRALTADELRQALEALQQEPPSWRRVRDETVITILFHTGLRVSELQGLDLGQVDLETGLLRDTKRKGGDKVDIALNDSAVQAMRRWLKARPAASDQAVFVNNKGMRLSVRMIQKRLKAIKEAAGLSTPLHPHALRHAHATALMRTWVPTEVIRQSLNHSSLQTTIEYLHSDEELLREALSRLPSIQPLVGEGDEEK